MSQPNDMQALAGRAEQLIAAITDAILSSAEAAAERIELASSVARVQTRMAAFGAVLEAIVAQKAALTGRLAGAAGAAKALLARQLDILAAQELSVLARVGVPEPTARAAVAAADAAPLPPAVTPTHRREGRRFVRLAPGTGPTNGVAEPPGDEKEGKDGS